jgi:hypothetical protein
MGGKAGIAGKLVAVLQRSAPGGTWWEPFCGGGNMTEHLALAYPGGLASDTSLAMVSLLRAVVEGWEPPRVVDEVDYRNARGLPDTDPRKAFILTGCSFGGASHGYARGGTQDIVGAARRALERFRIAVTAGRWRVEHADFFVRRPTVGLRLYCDPPYAGTTGYACGPFDHPRFWARCQEWARAGSRVFVSEYTCPVPHVLRAKFPRNRGLGVKRKATASGAPLELLVEVLP